MPNKNICFRLLKQHQCNVDSVKQTGLEKHRRTWLQNYNQNTKLLPRNANLHKLLESFI